MEQKKSYLIYYDYEETIFSELTDAEVGQLIRALIKYERDGELTTFEDRAVKTAYKRMLNDSVRNIERYKRICEKNRENIKKRWEKEHNPDNTK